ncbi:signal recognition particle-docking protein FtsY [Thermocrinis minervae]|uniref:Signal recognition particle receptor FtsY n=1 Tax=Thermocrinis minervae TaxID=381751 RepID=A0A1M6RJS4_9AQUI|nr:signal recognition particle-docking protein FtsY [Thermocrinis minervae]SHK32597.1 fused signal recognition particle receptor [Thermocrinis minervae]
MLFWKKSEEERKAEEGDKTAILSLIEKGKVKKAIQILEKFKDNPQLRPILFDLYLKEGKYYYAYQLLEGYDPNLGTAKERALVYAKAGQYKKAVEEYLKVGDFESLIHAGDLLYSMGEKEKALEVYQRALKLAPLLERQTLEEKIQKVKVDLGLVEVKKESFIDKLKKGLKKTKEAVEFGLLFRGRKVDEELFEELEERLIRADIGVKLTVKIVEELRKEAIRRNIKQAEELKDLLKGMLISYIKDCKGEIKQKDELVVYLFLGVNGSGKTTTIGKLAYRFVKEGKKTLLCAADTFRAAAIEQLEVWAQRSGADIVKKQEGSDPAAVVYEGLQKAVSEGYQRVLIDTAGRLHTKEPLIKELRKIKQTILRFVSEEDVETLLVLDATIGQNSISQAKVFKEAVDISGIILTKLDGTSKGGTVVPICQELKIPIKLLGLGEGLEDLQPFEPEAFVEELLS